MPCIWCDLGTCINPAHAIVREFNVPDDLPPLLDEPEPVAPPALLPIFDITGQNLRLIQERLPQRVPSGKYDRFWDLHLTDRQGWYDFALNILPEIRYQERKNRRQPWWIPGDGRVRVSWRIANAFRSSLREQQRGLGEILAWALARRTEVAALGAAPARNLLLYLQNEYEGAMAALKRVHQQPEVAKQVNALDKVISDLTALIRVCWKKPANASAELAEILRRIDAQRFALNDSKDLLANLEERLVDFDPDEDDAPTSSYFTTIISMDDLVRQIPSALGGSLVRWITDTGHRGKLRVSSHGDGKGNLFMEGDTVTGARVADWLNQNGLEQDRQPTGAREDRAGVKAEHGLVTINLSICMGGRGHDVESSSTVAGVLDARARTTRPALGSAVDLLVRRLGHYNIHGIEVTGSNQVVRDEGGRLGEVAGDDWTRLAGSERKVRAIS